jgi:hypothetical protein
MNMPSNQAPNIRCTLSHVAQLKPPLQSIAANVSISNTTSSELTLLVPAVLNPTAAARELSLFGVDTYRNHNAALTIYKLQGQANFWVFVVAAKANLEVRNLPIQFWPDEKATVLVLEMIHCARVETDRVSLSDALVHEPATGGVGTTSFDDFVRASSVSAPDCEEVALHIIEGQVRTFRFDEELRPA